MAAPATCQRIPVSLVSGFLGSGKTTLIVALLRQPRMQGAAVVVNEFGEVGIDDAIFADAIGSDDVALLANGCLCCAAGDDLARTVWSLTRREPAPPRRIVIETSGLADPAPALARLIADPRLRQSTRLDSLVVTIDAVNGMRNLDEQPIAMRQCAVADRRVVTKTDLAGPEAAAALAERLFALNPGASVTQANFGAVEAEALFGAALFDADSGRADLDRWLGLDRYRANPCGHEDHSTHDAEHGDAHDHSAACWLVEEERPVDWALLSPLLGDIVARHGDSLLRLKGVIWTAGDERPLAIHGVQRVYHAPVRLGRWTRPPKTSIVAIGDEGAAPAIASIEKALARAAVSELSARPSAYEGAEA
ncbi:MAG: CobW family GTP-binding protein [Propylenella sp.]